MKNQLKRVPNPSAEIKRKTSVPNPKVIAVALNKSNAAKICMSENTTG